MSGYRILPAGDTALIVEFGETIDRGVNERVLRLAQQLRAAKLAGVCEIVPTFRSLCVTFEPLERSFAQLEATIAALLRTSGAVPARGRSWRFPVCYDETLAIDLRAVAAATGLSPAQIVAAHSGTTYHVYMLGFLPGQAYLGDLPERLALPRRPTPRPRIEAGSVAIAMTMTCIFPAQTPCGWHVIGASPIPLWDFRTQAAPLLQPGDRVRFQAVSLDEYERWQALARQPDFRPALLADMPELAA